jgi:hypothetical protein
MTLLVSLQQLELKPEDETTEEIFKESIEIEKKPELEEVKLDITVDKTITETVFNNLSSNF